MCQPKKSPLYHPTFGGTSSLTPGLYPNLLRIVFSKDPPGEAPTTSQPESGLQMHLSPQPSIRQMGEPGGHAGNRAMSYERRGPVLWPPVSWAGRQAFADETLMTWRRGYSEKRNRRSLHLRARQTPALLGSPARAAVSSRGRRKQRLEAPKLPGQAGLERRLDARVDRGVLGKVLRDKPLLCHPPLWRHPLN